MYSLVLKIMFTFLTVSSLSYASGGGEPAPAPKEVKSNEESFGVVQARVQGLEAKVRSAEEEIKKLIEAKHHTKDTEKANEIIKQMISLHREMEHNVKEYDQQRALLKYRYPEKGRSDKRAYERIDVRSIEEMEGQMTLSSAVEKTLNKVRTQYKSAESKEKKEVGAMSASEKNKSKRAQPGLADPVVLKK